MKSKKAWYRSRTVWVNVLMLILAIIATVQETNAVPIEELAVIAAVVNVVLRFVTVDPIGWFTK